MSHTPPVPEAATPPFPAQPAASIDAEPATAIVGKKKKAKKPASEKPEGKRNVKKIAGVGAAIGIGSAAIVAALLYANRSKK